LRDLPAARRHRRQPVARRIASAALSLLLGLALWPAAAPAGGPGVTIFSARSVQPVTLSGNQIAAAADVPPTRYTVRRPGGSRSTITLRGLSVRRMLSLAGVSAKRFISVVRADGSLLVLTRADISGSSFAEGPALVTDEGASTRFFRPLRGSGAPNAADNIVTTSSGPLEISVDGGTLLAVQATASPRQTATGKTVTFRARVCYKPAGASLSYHWQFGDGSTASGDSVSHAYSTSGALQAQVAVRGTGGSRCSSFCGGVAAVDVRIGDPNRVPGAPEDTPGTGSGNPLAPGASTGGGGDGQGGAGGDGGVGDTLAKIEASRARSRAQEAARARKLRVARNRRRALARDRVRARIPLRADGALPVTGILIADAGTIIKRLPPIRAAATAAAASAAPKGVQATRGGSQETPGLGIGGALALLVMSLGALREGRPVRLRLA
jgi:hypothetical protein